MIEINLEQTALLSGIGMGIGDESDDDGAAWMGFDASDAPPEETCNPLHGMGEVMAGMRVSCRFASGR